MSHDLQFLFMAVFVNFMDFCTTYKMIKRNVYDPPSLLPLPKGPLPNGVELEQANPYLDTMHEPVDLKYGIAVHSSPGNSPQLGGQVYFPTGNLLRPMESFQGSYAQSRSIQARFGMQGGPFYPWQHSKFAENVREIEEASAINEQQFRRNDYATTNGVRRDWVVNNARHPAFMLPPISNNNNSPISADQPILSLIPPPALPANFARFRQ